MASSIIKSSDRFRAVSLGAITTSSTDKIYDLVGLPNNGKTYLVIFGYFSYTFADSASVYLFTNGTNNKCYGVNCIYQGSEGRSVKMSADGTLTTTTANTYNVIAVLISLS